jgi:selenocysteine-specific elongation factor
LLSPRWRNFDMHVVATAGHVDHGKSTLIRALTGTDPDRWAEEHRRGLTIDLGFAWTRLDPEDPSEVGFVDVPGHERFLANMLAGVGSVPAVMLVIDATEGWRQQTHEHVRILDLLEVRAGVVALTKIDRAAQNQIEAVTRETRQSLLPTRLAESQIVAVSANEGTGLPELKTALHRCLSTIESGGRGCARMWIDRAFTVRGAGLVGTGTLQTGIIRVGESVQVLGSTSFQGKVRGLHRHENPEDVVASVSRLAVNISGIESHQIARGMRLTTDSSMRSTKMFDAKLRVIEQDFDEKADWRIHVGTADCAAKVVRHKENARITLTTALPLIAGDRFVLRDTGRRIVAAGGTVLDPHPENVQERLPRAVTEDAASLIKVRGVLTQETLRTLIGSDTVSGLGVRIADHVADHDWLDTVTSEVKTLVETHHRDNPVSPGLPIEKLRNQLGLADGVVSEIVDRAGFSLAQGLVISNQERSRDPRLSATLEAIHTMGLDAPDSRELEAQFGKDVIDSLLLAGELVRLGARLVLAATVHQQAVQLIVEELSASDKTTAQLREALGTSRRVALPILENLDLLGVTRFDGSKRRLGPNAPTGA